MGRNRRCDGETLSLLVLNTLHRLIDYLNYGMKATRSQYIPWTPLYRKNVFVSRLQFTAFVVIFDNLSTTNDRKRDATSVLSKIKRSIMSFVGTRHRERG